MDYKQLVHQLHDETKRIDQKLHRHITTNYLVVILLTVIALGGWITAIVSNWNDIVMMFQDGWVG